MRPATKFAIGLFGCAPPPDVATTSQTAGDPRSVPNSSCPFPPGALSGRIPLLEMRTGFVVFVKSLSSAIGPNLRESRENRAAKMRFPAARKRTGGRCYATLTGGGRCAREPRIPRIGTDEVCRTAGEGRAAVHSVGRSANPFRTWSGRSRRTDWQNRSTALPAAEGSSIELVRTCSLLSVPIRVIRGSSLFSSRRTLYCVGRDIVWGEPATVCP